MRVSFFALASLALVASLAGLYGMVRHDPTPFVEAVALLPAPWGARTPVLRPLDTSVAAWDGLPEQKAPAPKVEPLQVRESEEASVDAYFAHPFPMAVRDEIDGVCPPKARRAKEICFTSIRAHLLKLGLRVQQRQARFRTVLQWSRVLWGAAGFFALLMLIRAYDQVRRQDRRLSRPHGQEAIEQEPSSDFPVGRS